ncbi:MAG TPA: hypothetical protein VJN93_11675 [Candidatus Acidoferrum sp.]|nr:hypothetical protein [Candidatus Acidoferrum sp.]
MKNVLLVAAVAVLGVTYGANRAEAQGPQGAGAGAAVSGSSSGSSHSFNPIHWVKKDQKASSAQLDSNDQDKKLTESLQAQGLLTANTDAKSACENFKTIEDCVATLHASKNTGADFNCLKSNVTGVQTSADMSGCKGGAGDKAISLAKAIRAVKPEADAKGEAKNAEKQAKDDLKALQG